LGAKFAGEKLWVVRGLVGGDDFCDEVPGFEIPDLDALRSGGAQPVAVRRESEGVDDASSVEGEQLLSLTEVPEECSLISSS